MAFQLLLSQTNKKSANLNGTILSSTGPLRSLWNGGNLSALALRSSMSGDIVMPLYCFDFTDGQAHRDFHEEYFKSDAAAWREALRHTRLIEEVLEPNDCVSLQVRTADKTIFRIDVTAQRM
jgi:hypothetical protein